MARPIESYLEDNLPTPLTRYGRTKLRDCTTEDLASAIRIISDDQSQYGTDPSLVIALPAWKAVRAAMNRHGVRTPAYLPFHVLEKIFRS